MDRSWENPKAEFWLTLPEMAEKQLELIEGLLWVLYRSAKSVSASTLKTIATLIYRGHFDCLFNFNSPQPI